MKMGTILRDTPTIHQFFRAFLEDEEAIEDLTTPLILGLLKDLTALTGYDFTECPTHAAPNWDGLLQARGAWWVELYGWQGELTILCTFHASKEVLQLRVLQTDCSNSILPGWLIEWNACNFSQWHGPLIRVVEVS